jgi:hypothetical protein
MQIMTFFHDLRRFQQHGLLFTACYLLSARAELLVWYGIPILFVVLFGVDSKNLILLCVTGIVITLIVFVDFAVQLLSPVFFGSFAIGRLQDIRKSRMRVMYDFVLVPSGIEISAGVMALLLARGTIGRKYLVLKHPANALVALPLIDDDPAFLAYILGFASSDRRDEILRQLEFLRGQNP